MVTLLTWLGRLAGLIAVLILIGIITFIVRGEWSELPPALVSLAVFITAGWFCAWLVRRAGGEVY